MNGKDIYLSLTEKVVVLAFMIFVISRHCHNKAYQQSSNLKLFIGRGYWDYCEFIITADLCLRHLAVKECGLKWQWDFSEIRPTGLVLKNVVQVVFNMRDK